MKLATAAEVMARMNLSTSAGGSDPSSIESALVGATSTLEGLLQTALSEAALIDRFDIPASSVARAGTTTLWTAQGFLYGDVFVYTSLDGYPIVSSAQAGVLAEGTDYVVNRSSGEITVLVPLPVGYSTVAVRYSAGFREPTQGVVSQPIPIWLKQAAISTAIYLVHTQAVRYGKKDLLSSLPALASAPRVQCQEYIYSRFGGRHSSSSTPVVA